MAYHTSNTAYAYDMQPDPAAWSGAYAPQAPAHERPQLGVVTGAGRAADQETSPAFRHCIKLFCALATVFVVVGLARVSIANVTAAMMNENASYVTALETAQDESTDLEVMYSVYGSSTRIRDLAESYGMVVAEESVTLDFTEYASSSATEAEDEADGSATEETDASADEETAAAAEETATSADEDGSDSEDTAAVDADTGAYIIMDSAADAQ